MFIASMCFALISSFSSWSVYDVIFDADVNGDCEYLKQNFHKNEKELSEMWKV